MVVNELKYKTIKAKFSIRFDYNDLVLYKSLDLVYKVKVLLLVVFKRKTNEIRVNI